LEHKSEENGKVSNSLLGTVPDGAKNFFMTASRVIQEVKVAKVRDDPEQICTKDMTASP
jgi:hypothetical protein